MVRHSPLAPWCHSSTHLAKATSCKVWPIGVFQYVIAPGLVIPHQCHGMPRLKLGTRAWTWVDALGVGCKERLEVTVEVDAGDDSAVAAYVLLYLPAASAINILKKGPRP